MRGARRRGGSGGLAAAGRETPQVTSPATASSPAAATRDGHGTEQSHEYIGRRPGRVRRRIPTPGRRLRQANTGRTTPAPRLVQRGDAGRWSACWPAPRPAPSRSARAGGYRTARCSTRCRQGQSSARGRQGRTGATSSRPATGCRTARTGSTHALPCGGYGGGVDVAADESASEVAAHDGGGAAAEERVNNQRTRFSQPLHQLTDAGLGLPPVVVPLVVPSGVEQVIEDERQLTGLLVGVQQDRLPPGAYARGVDPIPRPLDDVGTAPPVPHRCR